VSERRLSFCMVTTFYPPQHFGGDAMHAYRLTNALARRGHRVTVVHSVDAYRTLGGGEPAGSFPHEEGVVVRRLETRFPRGSALATYLTGRPALYSEALDAVFREQRFDVVHFHNVSLAGGPAVLRYGDGVKLYTTSEHWLVCPMHVLWRYDREPCDEPHCLRCTLAFRRPPQLWRYTSLLERELRQVHLFLSPSRFTLRAHQERGFTRPIRHLPYFLPETDAPTASTARCERPYFLYVGRLERLKGVQVLLAAFRGYREADLVIVGEGKVGAELRREASDLPHVRFLGRVHPSELPSLYASAVALIVPSIGFEVFGIVILEAFAQQTPAIVHDLGALPEVIEESEGGFAYRTTEELVAAMERLRQDATLRRELGARGHDAWRRLWTEEPHLAGYFAAIEDARGLAG
jgi:glycosyltransferase involved in cell wall biosynthesis